MDHTFCKFSDFKNCTYSPVESTVDDENSLCIAVVIKLSQGKISLIVGDSDGFSNSHGYLCFLMLQLAIQHAWHMPSISTLLSTEQQPSQANKNHVFHSLSNHEYIMAMPCTAACSFFEEQR